SHPSHRRKLRSGLARADIDDRADQRRFGMGRSRDLPEQFFEGDVAGHKIDMLIWVDPPVQKNGHAVHARYSIESLAQRSILPGHADDLVELPCKRSPGFPSRRLLRHRTATS